MVDKKRDSDRRDVNEVETGGVDADPTLDIVRQLIVEAEAIPAPAKRPAGPATPRPGAAEVAPAQAREPVAAPPVVPDVLPEEWDDDPEEDSWENLAVSEATRPYRIVDLDTGEVVADDGAGAAGEAGPEGQQARRLQDGLLWRLLSGTLRALATLLLRAVRALAALLGAGLAATGRVIARFLRRPDAPRRLATGLLVIFVIAWPFRVLWLTLLIPLAALITWASVGNEGCVELVATWHARLKARDPDKAERIRARAAATSRALNRWLERLPERWTQGLYLPDFETDGYVPEKLRVDPFEELAARVHSAKRAGGGT